MSNRRLLVTGGSGFIGTNLVDRFLADGWTVQSYDIARPRNSGHLACWSEIDILDRSRLMQGAADFRPDTLLHFAARTDLDERTNLAGYAANIEGVINVIDAIRATPSIERVIFASSQLVGAPDRTPTADDDYRPATLYGQSKLLGERIVRVAHEIDATWTIVRPTSIWGPWFGAPYLAFFLAIARGMYVHPAGGQIWKQWGYVGNAVFQVRQVLQADPALVHRKTFYVADYERLEIHEFADRVSRAFGARRIRSVPRPLLKVAAVLGDLAKKVGWSDPPLSTFRYDNIVRNETQELGAMRQLTGDLPYSLDDGIERTVQWIQDHHHRLPT